MANKKRKCKQCGDFTEALSGIKVPAGFFCSMDHAISFANEKRERQRAKQAAKMRREANAIEKKEKARIRKRKQELKPVSKIRSEAQAAINSYIRIRDYFEPCISCGLSREQVEAEQGWKVGGCWDAGHYQGRGAKGQLRFVLFNIHKQCKSCNSGSGKFSHKAATVSDKYKKNLTQKIGLEKVEWLENNNEIDLRKNDVEYLERVKRIFRKKTRLYKRRFRC